MYTAVGALPLALSSGRGVIFKSVFTLVCGVVFGLLISVLVRLLSHIITLMPYKNTLVDVIKNYTAAHNQLSQPFILVFILLLIFTSSTVYTTIITRSCGPYYPVSSVLPSCLPVHQPTDKTQSDGGITCAIGAQQQLLQCVAKIKTLMLKLSLS